MIVGVREDFAIMVGNLNAEGLAMLHALPSAVNLGDWRPWEQSPLDGKSSGPATRDLLADWDLLVRPELEAQCDTYLNVVLANLARVRRESSEEIRQSAAMFGVQEPGPHYAVEIAAEHVEAWYAVLNRARLAIEALHHFAIIGWSPEEVENLPENEQTHFWQSRMYGALQEALLFSMEQQFQGSTSTEDAPDDDDDL